MSSSNQTPMVMQYRELKAQHPGALLFFRLGDFYELFFDDAIIGARELQITLTARHKESNEPIPMCGVPHHAAANYIAKLVRKGYRVAICEQTEDASKAKKLVQRDVVRIVTPGTPIDPQLLEARETVYLAAVCARGETCGAAFLDLSTGEFRATQANGKDAWAIIAADVESYRPKELLFPNSIAALVRGGFVQTQRTEPLPLESENSIHKTEESTTLKASNEIALGNAHGSSDENDSATLKGSDIESGPAFQGEPNSGNPTVREGANRDTPQAPSLTVGSLPWTLTPLDDCLWQEPECAALLLKQFGARSLDGYGLTKKTEAIRAAGACLRYAQETQRAAASHITDIVYFEPQDNLVLDSVTVRNLELIEGLSEGATSLLKVIDETVTGMGARLLRSWLLRPSGRRGEIEARHGAVAELYASQIKRDRLRLLLKEVADVERLAGRLNLGSTTPRDLVALRRSLDQVPQVREALANSESSLLQVLHDALDELADVRSLVESAIQDDPPAKLVDGGVIRDGYSSELDELRSISRDAKQIIAGLEAEERARTGIGNLRIRYNNVFGYFIEVSKANAARVPDDYVGR